MILVAARFAGCYNASPCGIHMNREDMFMGDVNGIHNTKNVCGRIPTPE